MKILLLEDELMLQSSIREYFEEFSYNCTVATNGKEALGLIESEDFALLILDINVPAINGLKLVELLNKKGYNNRVIFISAMRDIETIAKAFDVGAADYIKKPFHLKELKIRVDKILQELNNNKDIVAFSKYYRYNPNSKKLFYKKQEQLLTKKHLDIIDCLCKNLNTIVTLDTIREYAWQSPVSDATIRSEISRLRKKLKDDFIKNYKGIGYRIDRY